MVSALYEDAGSDPVLADVEYKTLYFVALFDPPQDTSKEDGNALPYAYVGEVALGCTRLPEAVA